MNAIARVCRNRIRSVRDAIKGNPRRVPLSCMTIDELDAEVAREYLAAPSLWDDGERVSGFEEEFAAWNGSRHAFAFMAGRVALSACIHALGLRAGDEVIVPGYTCVVVPNAFRFAGIGVVFCDIETASYGLDAGKLTSAITPKTKAVLLHHLYGLVCRDYLALIEVARSHGLKVIEDCAHATGAELDGVKVGNLGDVAFYSSEQSKVFCTMQGGVAVTNDDRLAAGLAEYRARAPLPPETTVRKLLQGVLLARGQGERGWWRKDLSEIRYGAARLPSTTEEEVAGRRPLNYGMRMPPPLAALASTQLKKLDRYNEERRRTAAIWDRWCDSHGYGKPLVLPGSVPVFLRYPVMVEAEKKRDLSWALRDPGVYPGVWFTGNLHPAQHRIEGCSNADAAVRQCVNFPCLM